MSFLLPPVENMTTSHCNLDEIVRELVTELMHCTVKALYEIRKEWPEDLRAQGVNPKLVLFSEKLIDLVINHKEERTAVNINDIKIFPWFENTPPSPRKMEEKRNYLQETGQLPSEIVLDNENHLLDGYISYLLVKELGIQHIPIRHGKRQVIEAYHKAGGKLYAWELPDNLVDMVLPGDKVLVRTGNGMRYVTVVFIKEYGQQKHKDPLRMAIKKKICMEGVKNGEY